MKHGRKKGITKTGTENMNKNTMTARDAGYNIWHILHRLHSLRGRQGGKAAGGRRCKRVLGRIIGRGAVAVMTAAVLALTGVLPAGSGQGTGLIPATVEAAGPPTGTITYYRYTRLEKESDFPSRFDAFLVYQRGSDWFFTQNVTDINNNNSHWKVKNTNVDARIDPEAKVFQTRNKWSNIELYRSTWDGKKNKFTGYYVRQYTDGAWH